MGEVPARHRFSKEIAEDLIADKGAFAHLYALEKVETQPAGAKPMWRDVLAWLDELGGDDGGRDKRGDFPKHRPQLQDCAEDDS